MTEKLKPCPFCGGEGFIQGDDNVVFAGCLTCHCAVGEAYDQDGMPEHKFYTREDAIATWNTRPAETVNEQMMGALKRLVSGISTCHSCGAQLLSERGAAHCEDCPSGCEAHDAPDCPQIDELIEASRAAISRAEAAQPAPTATEQKEAGE